MANKKTAVFGIYRTIGQAEGAVDALVIDGFSNSDVSVLLPDNQSSRDFAHEKHTKAPEGTTTGAAAGGAIGGTLGLLAGIGALAIPGIGPFIAAGPIMGALAGLGAGALARSADSSVPWSAWGYRNTRRSATKAASRTAASCCPFTAIPRSRSAARRTG